jgi:hypothetical protein
VGVSLEEQPQKNWDLHGDYTHANKVISTPHLDGPARVA